MPKKKAVKKTKTPRKKILGTFLKDRVISEATNEARELYNQSRFGVLLAEGKVQLSLIEALYLVDKLRLQVADLRNKEIPFDALLKKVQRLEKNTWTRYCVFKDLRNRGYIVKTALKFGAEYRVYDRGVKPGEDHARWIVYPVREASTLTWHQFSAKNRVAHSTKKRLMISIVDDENDVTYYEIKWIRP